MVLANSVMELQPLKHRPLLPIIIGTIFDLPWLLAASVLVLQGDQIRSKTRVLRKIIYWLLAEAWHHRISVRTRTRVRTAGSVSCCSSVASFPVLPTPAFVSQPWRKNGCETKAGVETGNEASSSAQRCNKNLKPHPSLDEPSVRDGFSKW